MKCCEARAYLEAYSDAELCPDRALDVEAHLSDCSSCQGELELQGTVKHLTRSCCSKDTMSAEFASRLKVSVGEEATRQAHIRAANLPLSWSTITPLAAVAAAAFWFSFSANRVRTDDVQLESKMPYVSAAAGTDQLVEALVQHHSALKNNPRYRDRAELPTMEPELGLPIREPNLDRYGARFEGAEILHMKSANAASLYYSVAGRRVTLYVYDPEELPLRTMRDLEPRVVGNRAVFVGKRRGYSIAACERQGVGYAVATDLTDEESAELVATLGN